MRLDYITEGTCSKLISVDVEDGVIRDVKFVGGCHGNLQGICALVRGKRAADVISTLEGIRCRDKATSCPDQLAHALRQAIGG